MSYRAEIASFLTRLLNRRRSPAQQRPSVGPVPRQYPLGLNQDQVDHLRQLLSTPQWRSFSEALQAVSDTEIRAIISGLPYEQYQQKCGKVQALLDVLSLPETIDQKAREIDEHQRPADTGPSPQRDLTFFGSPFWSPSRKPRIYGPDDQSDAPGSVARP